ncbi:hypothetical protein [Arthrobacter oryzae]|uniref:hypothetical protein n=1 Tax=Arthrobacter oryzae TaxID=409290 RepID=UPI00273AB8E7|nr:hypothetical protein [Arthrobacter oryzae]WLQ07095.1 hypothetical protein Q8Z05_02775 [Arthrobacter oryzae]
MTVFAMILLALSQAGAATAAPVAGLPVATPLTATPAPTPAPGGVGIRLLDIPASTKDDPRARTYIIDRLAPGSEISRRIQVENNTRAAQSVRLYSGAAHIDGGSFIGEDAGVKNDLSTWTTVAQPQVELAAGASAEVLVTIKVPSDAAEGEQYGAIWAEVRSAGGKGGVVQANRAGIRVYLSVGPGNGKPADFTISALTPARGAEGNPQLSALVTNTGGRALDVSGELSLTAGPGGLSAGPFAVQQATTIAPGNSQNVTFTLPGEVPNGPWTAQVRLKSGLLERQASAPVTFPDAGPGEAVTPVQGDGDEWLPLIAIAGTILVLLALGIFLFLARRKRRRLDTPAPGTRRSQRQNANVTR